MRLYPRGLLEGELTPVNNDHETVHLNLIVGDEFLKRQEQGTINGAESVGVDVPVGREQDDDSATSDVCVWQYTREAIAQRGLDTRLCCIELLEEVWILPAVFKVSCVQLE